MRFAGYVQEGRLSEGGVCRGVLRSGGKVVWSCTHEHESRTGAVVCAYQAEHVATLAGLLPEPPQAVWRDPTTWGPGLAPRARRAHA